MTGFPGVLEARAGHLTAAPAGISWHCGGETTVWPLRTPGRTVVRALLLHGPVVSAWRVVRGRGRFTTGAVDPDGALRGQRTRWRPPYLLLLDAHDAPVLFVPLHRWHPWGAVHGADRRAGGPRAGRDASAAAARAVLDRTGWSDLLVAAGLPWTDAHSLQEEEVRQVVEAAAGAPSTPAVLAPANTPGERRAGLVALALTVLLGLAQSGFLPGRGGGPRPHDPALQALTLLSWALLVTVAGLHRLTLHLRTRRGRRALPAQVVSGAPTGVRFLRAARPDGTSETGLLERGREAWFPATGPSALAVVTLAHWPGPFDPRASDPDLRGPREPELRLANADGVVLGVVPVHALLGRRLDLLQQVDDDLVEHLASVAAELGCRFEVVARPFALLSAPPLDDDYPAASWSLLALLLQLTTTWWSLRLALTGQVSWLVLPVGVAALVAFSLLWLPRRPRDGVGGVRVLPDGG